MSISQTGTSESGQLPGRYEWVEEPAPGAFPSISNPTDFNAFSDAVRTFEADAGASIARQDTVGTADALDHFRGTEDPSATVEYDLQRFPVDGDNDPVDPTGYGIVRDSRNDLLSTLLLVGRREFGGGNFGGGVREYTVVRGAAIDTVSAELDPSSEQPILASLDITARRVRSYLIHQPDGATTTTLSVTSTSDNDTMDLIAEDEGGSTSETVTLSGTTTVTTTASFSDIDATFLTSAPEGTITVTDGDGTTVVEIEGGNTYSDDDQPVDGDRGVPALNGGSHASAIGSSFEHFVGDRFERGGDAVRPRINSASFEVANNINTQSLHNTRAPAIDAGNREVTVSADAAGEFVSHDSLMESLQLDQQDIVHELSGGTLTFRNTVPQDAASRTIEADQSVATISETFGASGDPAIELAPN